MKNLKVRTKLNLILTLVILLLYNENAHNQIKEGGATRWKTSLQQH